MKEAEVHATEKRDRVMVTKIDEHIRMMMVREDGVWRPDLIVGDDFKHNFKPVTDSAEYAKLLGEATEAFSNISPKKTKLPRLFVIDDYYQKRESYGPFKCRVCGYEATSKNINRDITYIELDGKIIDTDEEKKVYVCADCAHEISGIYSELHPLKKFVVYILIMFGTAVIIKACEDIFF